MVIEIGMDFDLEVLKRSREIPVLVDFWAPWCGPCKAISPMLEEIAKEFDGKLEIKKLNVDEHKKLTADYGIKSIPALFYFEGGKSRGALVGSVTKDKIRKFIGDYL